MSREYEEIIMQNGICIVNVSETDKPKTIQKPLKCRNERCGSSCSIIDAQLYGDNPKKCPYYEYNPYLYDNEHNAKVRADAIDEFAELLNDTVMDNPKTIYDYREVFNLGYRLAEQLKEQKNG